MQFLECAQVCTLEPPIVAVFQIEVDNYEEEKDRGKTNCDDVEMCFSVEEIVHTFYTPRTGREFHKAADSYFCSARPLRPLRLGGESFSANIHRRGAEHEETGAES